MLATMSDSEKTQRAGKDAMNFTKTAIEALPMLEKGLKYYYDTKVSGLAIRIGPSGVKTFILKMAEFPVVRHRPSVAQQIGDL
ncbi:hypothetical protein WS75_21720 [Burkholderia sp. FL-7-2-10-S1-D7]|uniref:Arm DNA-binding domain-containing protein n=1 Tax=Burkholderia sp. FL-7-2-10-S1-D7 TaxID=1637866 RepID=UPI0007598789|nr:Arm DNA-binding domain-containing protein [Burkholderia sp. FL-7-2-10-S1-D7]KVF71592.1 hypothetical protein WS75_21720 [Burkholderia sp. FL-7-2-10-S1-D7]